MAGHGAIELPREVAGMAVSQDVVSEEREGNGARSWGTEGRRTWEERAAIISWSMMHGDENGVQSRCGKRSFCCKLQSHLRCCVSRQHQNLAAFHSLNGRHMCSTTCSPQHVLHNMCSTTCSPQNVLHSMSSARDTVPVSSADSAPQPDTTNSDPPDLLGPQPAF